MSSATISFSAERFKNLQILDTAKTGDFYFGLSNNKVRGQSYMFNVGERINSMTVTADTCMPMTLDVIGKEGESEYLNIDK